MGPEMGWEWEGLVMDHNIFGEMENLIFDC
jgi:hypothetical protein